MTKTSSTLHNYCSGTKNVCSDMQLAHKNSCKFSAICPNHGIYEYLHAAPRPFSLCTARSRDRELCIKDGGTGCEEIRDKTARDQTNQGS